MKKRQPKKASDKIAYREAKKSDWKGIKSIVALYPKVLIQDNLPSYNKFFVAEHDKKVVGCCALDIYSKRIAEIRSLVVRSDYQGKGIGAQLIKLCLGKAKKKKIFEIIAITGKENLFNKFGFSTFKDEKMALFKVM